MHRLLLDIPERIEAERLYLRSYRQGDGRWYYAMSQRNRSHLERYEPGNAVMSLKTEEEAEILVRELAADWAARNCFFMGAFERGTDEFLAQIYVGPIDWNLPELSIGYFADVDHEGQGFVTEAVRAALRFAFEHLAAHRVRIECDDTNVRSYRVAERCGFVREARIRENKKNPDGTITGTLIYGLLKNEFQDHR
jgi:aminoglycoside 6'-N-acetyltransferase